MKQCVLQSCLGALTFREPLVGMTRARQHKKMRRFIADNKPGARTFVIFRSRAVDRLLARMKSARLDQELAAGRLPQSSRLHAARADRLVSPSFRNELADNWERVLRIAAGRTPPGQGRFVLHYDRIAEAEPRIRELADMLRVSGPVPARGVASANLLLTDGMGPLYNPLLTGKTVLSDAVAAAVAMLDPARQ